MAFFEPRKKIEKSLDNTEQADNTPVLASKKNEKKTKKKTKKSQPPVDKMASLC